uniref:N-acetylgalactosamine kinase-like n=2 Tax=Hirondellea gigas TaxID=1518452 RepID=A0A6A7G9C7_9CRUS
MSSTDDDEVTSLKQYFVSQFDQQPHSIVRAPGRINLIGEHIDYNGYSVLPIAIKQSVFVAVSTNTENKINILNYIPSFPQYSCHVSEVSKISKPPAWYDYVLCGIYGVQQELKLATLPGMNFVVMGKVPMAAGLSSSSALVCGAAVATNSILKTVEIASTLTANGTANAIERRTLSMETMAHMCAAAEKHVGTEGGGMDQAACLLSREGSAQLISFNPLRCTVVTLPKGATFVVANSLHPMNKAATSDFNLRVVECKLARSILAKASGHDWEEISTLNALQLTLNKSLDQMVQLVNETLHEEAYTLDEIAEFFYMNKSTICRVFLTKNTKHITKFKLHSRALHVFSEARRVFKFKQICDEWTSKESAGQVQDTASVLSELGALMYESHVSTRDHYECSHPALDELVELSHQHAAGARLTGAGWGGCTVALVREDKVAAHCDALIAQYYDPRGIDDLQAQQALFTSPPGPGATVILV